MSIFLLITGALALSAGLVFAFRPGGFGVMVSYVGMWLMSMSGYAPMRQQMLIFWAVATIIVCGIWMARSGDGGVGRGMRNFITGGALAGIAVGLTLGEAEVILSGALGAVTGGLAYSSTPAGKALGERPWRGIVSVGLPAVVNLSIIGLTLGTLIGRMS